MAEIGEKAAEYMVLNFDGTVSLNGSAKELGTTPELLEQFKKGINAINGAVKQGNIKVNDDMTISKVKTKEDVPQRSWSVDFEFVGTYFYLDDSSADELEYKATLWGFGAGSVAAVPGYIASKGIPYDAAVTLASGLAAIGFAALAFEANHENDGDGVVIYLSNWNPIDLIDITSR